MSSPAVPRSLAVLYNASRICLPVRFGKACFNKATAPATCGAAIEVPVADVYPPELLQERTDVPGADTSGLINNEPVPPQSEGPRLDELVIGSFDPASHDAPLIFATQNTFTEFVLIFFGFVIVEAPDPLFPAENTTAIPAASTASRVVL